MKQYAKGKNGVFMRSFEVKPIHVEGSIWNVPSQTFPQATPYTVRVHLMKEPNADITNALVAVCNCMDWKKNKRCKHSLAVIRKYDESRVWLFLMFRVDNYKDLNAAIDAHLVKLNQRVAA